jgi:hypothetical protein
MRYVLILCTLSILALPPLSLADPADTTADKQPANSRVDPNSRERTIATCVKEVRQEVPYSRFDAYARGSALYSFGSPQERVKFEKCMYKHGQPVSFGEK